MASGIIRWFSNIMSSCTKRKNEPSELLIIAMFIDDLSVFSTDFIAFSDSYMLQNMEECHNENG